MKLYVCRRSKPEDNESWTGALLIYANNQSDASEMYSEFEDGDIPGDIHVEELERGVIYNDEYR